jgi:repressor LexA
MADPLTDRQREVLEEFVAAVGNMKPAPTYREICEALNYGSTHAAYCHVNALIKKGWLERVKGRARSLSLTDHARRIYGLPGRAA